MVDGFLGRWSQRKQDVRSGRPVQEPDRAQVPGLPISGNRPPPDKVAVTAPTSNGVAPKPTTTDPAADVSKPAAPTLQDVAALRADSDFTPFVARAVAPEVRNAAMKKLFADPHFNVMDGLDTYIDDYSLPDPLPAAMLRKMASAKFMQLFDDDATADDAGADSTPSANESPAPAVAADQNSPAKVAPEQTIASTDSADPPASTAASDLAPDQPDFNVTDTRT